MTLGPMFIPIGLAERWRGRLVDMTATFGRVPMFYYLLHIPVIHLAAIAVSLIREGQINRWLFGNHPMAPPPVPEGYAWSLILLYLVFALYVIVLYFPCRWFARVRSERASRTGVRVVRNRRKEPSRTTVSNLRRTHREEPSPRTFVENQLT